MIDVHNTLVTIQHYSKICFAFLFSHVGLCALVAGYAIFGAFTFRAIELPYELERQGHMANDTNEVVTKLLEYTKSQAVLKKEDFKAEADKLLRELERKLVYAVNFEGYDGDDNKIRTQWTFSGSLLYSIAVITTIGYGNIVPKTDFGKMVTCLYALIGIPLMLMCLANIADTLARFVTHCYVTLCCVPIQWLKRKIKLKLPKSKPTRRPPSAFRSQPGSLRRRLSKKGSQGGRPATLKRHGSISYQGSARSNSGDYATRSSNHRGTDLKWESRSLPGSKQPRRQDTGAEWELRSITSATAGGSGNSCAQSLRRDGKERHSIDSRQSTGKIDSRWGGNQQTSKDRGTRLKQLKGTVMAEERLPCVVNNGKKSIGNIPGLQCCRGAFSDSPMSDDPRGNVPMAYTVNCKDRRAQTMTKDLSLESPDVESRTK